MQAARFQLSAFSCQLLQKHRQHAFDFGDVRFELFIVHELNQLQISTQEDLILELASRASGDTAKAGQLSISASSASFGYVRSLLSKTARFRDSDVDFIGFTALIQG